MQERHPLQIKNGGRVWVEREVWKCIANWRLLALDNIGFKPNARQKFEGWFIPKESWIYDFDLHPLETLLRVQLSKLGAIQRHDIDILVCPQTIW